MRPSTKELGKYKDHVDKNYQTLIDVLQGSAEELNTLLTEKDPPHQDNPSFIEFALDIALTVVAPQVWGFVKAKLLSEAAKALAADAGMVFDDLKAVMTAKDKGVAHRIAAKEKEKEKGAPETRSATLGMMNCISKMRALLMIQKASATTFFEALEEQLNQKGAKVDALFAETNWKQPPELLGYLAEKIQYVFLYTLVREAIRRYVEIHVSVSKTWGQYYNTGSYVVEYKPIGLSKVSMDWIFGYFKGLDLDGKELPVSANVPGGPATNRIMPVTIYPQLATAWQPRVEIEEVEIPIGRQITGERLASIFIYLYYTCHGYVPRRDKFGNIEGYDNPVTAAVREVTSSASAWRR